MSPQTLTVFNQQKCIVQGSLSEVIETLLSQEAASTPNLIFNDDDGKVIEIDLRGTAKEIYERVIITYPNFKNSAESSQIKQNETSDEEIPARGRGRPKLGVVAKEITLLPRHWEWLAEQPSGASATLRRLVEEAKKKNTTHDAQKKTQERTYRFMHAVAGNLPLYEEALRALFANDQSTLIICTKDWPIDIQEYIKKLSS